jgi:peptidoglycan/xylan/chitin deacetylase (PgdA/CDA1 family)
VYDKVVYLTFDDGPDPLTTPGTLTALENNGAHATFCMVGSNGPVGVQPNPGLIRRMYTDGDALCDHTWDHPDMSTLTNAQQQTEVINTRNAIYSAVGKTIPLFFRFPYGSGTAFTENSLASWGLISPAAFWNFDNQDWYPLCPGAAAIQASVEANVFDGATVLLHDVSYCGVAQMSYVGPLVQWLHANGYDVRALSPGVYPAQTVPALGTGSQALVANTAPVE